MESTAKLLGSIASLIWPILASALVWRLIPTFTKVIEARSFTIKFAGMELSAQQATDQLATQIKDLQNKIAMLEGQSNTRTDVEAVESANTIPDATHSPKRILWVDDQPKNNAFEIARLKEDGWDIQQAVSTSEAMSYFSSSGPFPIVVSDMGRREGGRYVRDAGVQLIQQIREIDKTVPIFIYSSQRQALTQKLSVKEAGGNDITSSPTDLFHYISMAYALSRGQVKSSAS